MAHNMHLRSGFHSLMVGAARTSCSGWTVQDSDCLCIGSEAWREKRLHALKTIFFVYVKCSATHSFISSSRTSISLLHPVTPLVHSRGAHGTFKEGSATLRAGPWGPFTGSTSRDTLTFTKPLGIKNNIYLNTASLWCISFYAHEQNKK